MKSLDNNKTKELELELFNILNDYGDFFLTNYPKQAETKSINPTIERIMKLFTQQRTELLEEILNLECLKEEKITKNIFSITQLESRNKLRNEIKEEIKKL